MSDDTLPPFLRHLLQPEAYPHAADSVKLVQTHISYVLLAGDFVYKFKKPVDFGFLNFTTLEKRRYFCEQELQLNRRLCPGLYLGLVQVSAAGAGYLLQPAAGESAGSVVEYGVRMARMPEERMMANIMKAGQLTGAMVDAICDTLVPFYEQAESGPEIRQFGTAAAVSINVFENFTQSRQFVGAGVLAPQQFAAIERYARDFLNNEALFQARIDQGRIRDCHGDLYSANICLAEQIYIYDCIEFNQRFRYCDVASDVAFLLMDLDFHGLATLGQRFLDRFLEATQDHGLPAMLNFYKCYRAYVRGKIGLFTAHAPEVDEQTRQQALDLARRYFVLAEQYAAR